MNVPDYYQRLQARVDKIIMGFPADAIVSIGGRKVYVCDGCGTLRFMDDGLHVRIHPSQLTAACNNQN